MSASSNDFTLKLSPEDCASVVSALVSAEADMRNYRPKVANEYKAARERIVAQISRHSRSYGAMCEEADIAEGQP